MIISLAFSPVYLKMLCLLHSGITNQKFVQHGSNEKCIKRIHCFIIFSNRKSGQVSPHSLRKIISNLIRNIVSHYERYKSDCNPINLAHLLKSVDLEPTSIQNEKRNAFKRFDAFFDFYWSYKCCARPISDR